MRITKKVRGKKREMRMAKKENKINKQTIKERKAFFEVAMVGPFTYIQNVMSIVCTVLTFCTLGSSFLNAHILDALLL